MVDELSQVSPLTGLLDRVLGRDAGRIANFGIDAARDWAWHVAEALAPLPVELQAAKIQVLDRLVAALGRELRDPDEVLAALY
ncbi:MAG: DUF5995 family protein, partial [bacterium]